MYIKLVGCDYIGDPLCFWGRTFVQVEDSSVVKEALTNKVYTLEQINSLLNFRKFNLPSFEVYTLPSIVLLIDSRLLNTFEMTHPKNEMVSFVQGESVIKIFRDYFDYEMYVSSLINELLQEYVFERDLSQAQLERLKLVSYLSCNDYRILALKAKFLDKKCYSYKAMKVLEGDELAFFESVKESYG